MNLRGHHRQGGQLAGHEAGGQGGREPPGGGPPTPLLRVLPALRGSGEREPSGWRMDGSCRTGLVVRWRHGRGLDGPRLELVAVNRAKLALQVGFRNTIGGAEPD